MTRIKSKRVRSEQQRRADQVNGEIRKLAVKLHDRFLHEFSTAKDPEGEEMVKLFDQIDTQWRLFLTRKGVVVPETFNHMSKLMTAIVDDYKKFKGQAIIPADKETPAVEKPKSFLDKVAGILKR